jgi:hypothetical protein
VTLDRRTGEGRVTYIPAGTVALHMSDAHRSGEPARDPSWVETLDDVLDSAVERDDALELRAVGVRVDVPVRMDSDAERARWRFDGTVRISVEGASGPLAEWLRWWRERTGSDTID